MKTNTEILQTIKVACDLAKISGEKIEPQLILDNLNLLSLLVEAPVKPANGDNKFQKFYLGEEVLLTIPMEKALEGVAPERLSSKGIIEMIWLKLGKVAMYKVKLEREVLGERIMQTDGKILSRLSV